MKKGRRTAGHPAHRDLTREHLTVLKQFESWLAQSDEIAAPTPAEESAFFVGVLLLGQQMRLNLRRPTDVEEIIEFLLDRDDEADEDIVEMTLDVLHDYIHFRLQTAGSDAWEAAHETIIAAFGPDDPAADALARAVADGQALSETERRAGLAATLVVERVRDLLRWVGSGRAVAPSGGVRRADISTVASMLGVAAVGVSKYPKREVEPALFEVEDAGAAPGTTYALSMGDVPLLPAWWEALHAAQLIERAGSRVRPGSMAASWLSEETAPLDAAQTLVAIFVAGVLRGEALLNGVFGPLTMMLVVDDILHAFEQSVPLGLEDESESMTIRAALRARASRTMEGLASVGLVKRDAEGRFTAPPEVRGAVATGVLAALAMIADADDLEGRPDGEDLGESPSDDIAEWAAEALGLGEATRSGSARGIRGGFDFGGRPQPRLLRRRTTRVAYVVRVDLDDARPPIWRRVRLASDLTLDRVHDILQVVMGWSNEHLHQFQMGPDTKDLRIRGFLTDFDLGEGEEGIPERDVRLDQVLAKPGQRLFYWYDFGDSWHHTVKLEKVEPWRGGDPEAFCLTGRRACPPEDVGGMWGYAELLDALDGELGDDPESMREKLEWLSPGYDPADFDVHEVNRILTTGA